MSAGKVSTELNDNVRTIRLSERFDFDVHDAFRKAYQAHAKPPEGYCVDLHKVNYMDSAALGMLLLLQEHAGNKKELVKLVGAQDDIKQLLIACDFNEFFKIE